VRIVTKRLASLGILLALAAPAASARDASPARVLAIAGSDRRTVSLVELAGEKLAPTGRGVRAEGFAGAWSFSADRSRLALASSYVASLGRPAGIFLVDAQRVRSIRRVRLSAGLGHVAALAWVRGDRVVVLLQGRAPSSVLSLDLTSGRIRARHELGGLVMGGVHRPGGFVLLLAPPSGIGAARVVTIDAQLGVRTVTLARIRAGWAQGRPAVDVPMQQREPGLAVDAAGERAFVVGAGEPLAEIDLRTLRTSYRAYEREPQALAKSMVGPVRQAEWLGDGVLAVAGWRWAGLDRATRRLVGEPAGLSILDTRTSKETVVDPGARSFTLVAGVLVVAPEGAGLVGYARDGRRLYSAYEGRRIEVVRGVGSRLVVVVEGEQFARIVDARTGRELGRRPGGVPLLLATDRSPIY
jgi:hypothetical protein